MTLSNVLIIGSMDTDEKALAKAVLGEDRVFVPDSEATNGDGAVVYESTNPLVPLRLIDARGIDSSTSDRVRAARAMAAWSKRVVSDGDSATNVSFIWLCVEMTPKGPSPAALRALTRTVKLWGSVPVIAVITKRHSQGDCEWDVRMLREVLSERKRLEANLKDVICLADDSVSAFTAAPFAPKAVAKLIDTTILYIPEGMLSAEKDVRSFQLKCRRAQAHRTVATFSAAGSLATILPLPISDALALTMLEAAELDSLALLFNVRQENTTKKLLDMIVELGTIGVAARATIHALSLIPGVRLKTGAANALIAGLFIAAIGEGASYTFEQVYQGKVSLDDLGWARNLLESKVPQSVIEQVTKVIVPAFKNAESINNLGEILTEMLAGVRA